MLDQPGKALLRFQNVGPMSGQEPTGSQAGQAFRRLHEIPDVSVGRRHERGRPFHHVIAREDHVIHSKGKMTGKVAGRVNHFKLPVLAVDDVAVGYLDVGAKQVVDAFATAREARFRKTLHGCTSPGLGRPETKHGCSGSLSKSPGKRAVVGMRVRYQYVGDVFARRCTQNCIKMGFVFGPGIYDCNPTLADNVAVRSPMGHHAGIRGKDAPNSVSNGSDMPCLRYAHRPFFSRSIALRVMA